MQLIAVGDVMLGRGIVANAQTLAQVTPWIEAADLAVGNFEGVIAPMGKDPAALSKTAPGEPYHLVMPEITPRLLHKAGFDLLSLANNHALDMGNQGLKRTIRRLGLAGLQVFGAAPAVGEPAQPAIADIKGLRIAFLGYTLIPPPYAMSGGPVPARYDPAQAAEDIKAVRSQADIVVVWMHWGEEYRPIPDASQTQAAQALVKAGADLVIGAHPHVIQGTQVFAGNTDQAGNETVRRQFVAYSLGNFVFDQGQGDTSTGLAIRIYLDKDGLRAVEALPLKAGTHPKLLSGEAAQDWFARYAPQLKPPSQRLAFTCSAQDCQDAAPADAVQDGEAVFWSGAVDLTGDGKPETIRRIDGQIKIEEAGQVVWSSPPEWQVLDLATGDPNNDGRYELLVSLRKPDPNGVIRSHPFIVGYRDGMYKLLWGGSALSTPIGEVALGDLDGDGNQELINLEEQPDRLNTIAVWRWHGWGFSLLWRSALGHYSNLRLNNPKDASVQIIVDKSP